MYRVLGAIYCARCVSQSGTRSIGDKSPVDAIYLVPTTMRHLAEDVGQFGLALLSRIVNFGCRICFVLEDIAECSA